MTGDEIARLRIQIEEKGLDSVMGKLAALDVQGARTAKSTENLDKKFSGLDRSVGDFNRTMTGAKNVVSLVKFPALIAGAGMATQAIGALGAGAIGLGSALAPLSGLAVAGGAGYAAMGQAMGVAKLATMGVSDALAGNKDALKALPPAGRELVATLKALKPELKGLQQTAQAGVLPGVQSALKNVIPLFPVLKGVVRDTAGVLGDLAARAGRDFSTWGGDITRVGNTNVTVIHNIGLAALALANALRNVIVVGGPLLTWVSRMALEGAKWVDVQVQAGRASGDLAGFLEQTRAVASTLGRVLGNLGGALFNIGKAAAPLGRDLLGQIEQLTARFREWTGSVSGQNQLAAYFRNAREPIMQIAGLVGDIGGAFIRLSQGKGATGLISQLRTLVPIFEQVVASTTAAFGPALIDTLGEVLRVFGHLAGSSGPLVHLVQLIGLLAQGMNALLDSVPGLNSMTVSMLGLYGATKALYVVFGPLVGAVRGTAAAFGALMVASNATTASMVVQKAGLIATGIAMYGAAAATAVMTGATAALGVAVAVLTSPITLTIAAIAALVVGIIYAYKHSETFRNVIDSLWATIKPVAAWLATAGVAAFHAVADAVKFAWELIQTVTVAVWGGLITYLTNAWGDIADAAVKVWRSIDQTVIGAWTAVRDATLAIWGFIKDKILVPVWGAIKTVATTSWDLIKAAILTPIRGVRDGLAALFTFIKDNVLVPAWAAIQSVASTAWAGIKAVILAPIREVRDLLGGKDGIWAHIESMAVTAFDSIKGAIKKAADPILDVILWPFKQAAKKVGSFAKLILTVIEKIPGVGNEKIDDAKAAIDKLVGGLAKGGVYGLARGGAFARTGGIVNRPITMMGEEAPRHPEFVIPTNPAYRNRARGLLGQAAGAIGYAGGGRYSIADMSALWLKAEGPPQQAPTAGAVGWAESTGNPNAVGSMTQWGQAKGLWQILGAPPGINGNIFDPLINARMAVAKFLAAGRWDGPWLASRDGPNGWKSILGGKMPPGMNPSIGSIVGNLNPLDLIKKLPGVGDLPDWLQGTGKWVLKQVGEHIKSLVSSIGGGGGETSTKGLVPQVTRALAFARSHGWHGSVNSGFRTYEEQAALYNRYLRGGNIAAKPGTSSHEKGQAVDVSDIGGFARAMAMAPANSKLLSLVPGDPVHFSVTGHAKGGLYGAGAAPFVGAYRNGGTVPADGFGYLHKGETVTPAGGGPLVNVEHMEVKSEMDLDRFARQVGWQIASAS